MDDNFTLSVKDIIATSKKEAIRLNSKTISTGHLLLGILKNSENEAVEILSEYGVNLNNIVSLISQHLYIRGSYIDEDIKSLSLTTNAERALKTTFLEAKLFQDEKINAVHLLLCILRIKDDYTCKLLGEYGIVYDQVKDFYKNYLIPVNSVNEREFIFDELHEEDKFYLHLSEVNQGLKVYNFKNLDLRLKRLEYIISKNSEYTEIKINHLQEAEIQCILSLKKLKKFGVENSKIKNFDFLSKLLCLERIYINKTSLEDIRFLKSLSSVDNIDVAQNHIKFLPSLTELKNLKVIDISSNKLSELNCELPNSLEILFLHDNEIHKISEKNIFKIVQNNKIFNLENLLLLRSKTVGKQFYEKAARIRDYEKKIEKKIYLSDREKNEIRDLYIEISLDNLPLKSPPYEIVKEGAEDLKIYFTQLKEIVNEKYLYEGKLLILGEGGVGKTSFAKKMANTSATLPSESETTFNIDISQITFNLKETNENLYLNLWDFGGQKIYRGTHQMFFSESSLYVIVDDNREEKTDFSFWINTIIQLGGEDCSIMIVINKKEGRENISFDESGYRAQFGDVIKAVLPVNLKNDIYEIDYLRETLHMNFKNLPLIGNPLPESWVLIRNSLSDIKENYITYDRFSSICRNYDIDETETINTLCNYFDNIGVFTHYSDDALLRERIYLNSNWLVKTIYEVLDNPIIDKNKGRITAQSVHKIWKSKKLDHESERLSSLMNRFGLMYLVESTDEYVVPEKLPKAMPYKFWKYENEQILNFKYEFDKYNPRGLMSKLIVSLNRYIEDHSLVWHRGLNIKFENSYAQIIETYKSYNSFEIKVVGNNRKALLAIIVDHFDRILAPFKKLNFEKKVQCCCSLCIDDSNPEFFKYSSLLKRLEKNIKSIECEKNFEKINVSQLIDGITPKENTMRKVKIFLASSSELNDDRIRVERFVGRLNKVLIDRNIFLELNIWEDFLDAMSRTRLQDEYNKVISNCDIFISLFGTKVGKYTQEEFEIAYEAFVSNSKPKYIFTYFKDIEIKMSEIKEDNFKTIVDFKRRLDDLGHFHSSYIGTDDLERQLRIQFDKILEKEKIF